MNFKRIIAVAFVVPILFVLYLQLMHWAASLNFDFNTTEKNFTPQGPGEMGMDVNVKISVTRPYLFGIIRLPLYIGGFNMHYIHLTYFWVVIISAIIFCVIPPKKKKNKEITQIDFY